MQPHKRQSLIMLHSTTSLPLRQLEHRREDFGMVTEEGSVYLEKKSRFFLRGDGAQNDVPVGNPVFFVVRRWRIEELAHFGYWMEDTAIEQCVCLARLDRRRNLKKFDFAGVDGASPALNTARTNYCKLLHFYIQA